MPDANRRFFVAFRRRKTKASEYDVQQRFDQLREVRSQRAWIVPTFGLMSPKPI
jgi:hypothetical protein